MTNRHTHPETFQAVIDDVRRTVAVAAWKGALVQIDAETRRLADRHAGALLPPEEIRECLLRLAAEQQVPAEIG